MNKLICKIKSKGKDILKGEIGALLHDIGKMHPDFIRHQSIERTISFSHENICNFLDPILYRHICDSAFDFAITTPSNIKNLIEQHHEQATTDCIVKYLQKCDRKDSADDKGIVRRKQSIDNTIISSPFGYEKEKIDLSCLQKRFDDLQNNLIELFKNCNNIISFRKSLIDNLKTAFSHALGETRIPANDVTLWDHSYSTASLFKTILAGIACDGYKDMNDVKWRIFGVCWNGEDFINRGRKIADIQKRAEVIDNIKEIIKDKLEVEFPVGNVIYEDINGMYFTFPELGEDSKSLASDCAELILREIYDKKDSDNELWPFFTLSKPSGSLTIIANELKRVYEKRKIPKVHPFLLTEGGEEEPIEILIDLDKKVENKENERLDVCPICRIRTKSEKDERCTICENRRRGRLEEWLNNRRKSVWIDEIADKNNRVSLISLSFDLDKWLDGTMIGSIFSQTFEDWYKKNNNAFYEFIDSIKDKNFEKIVNSLTLNFAPRKDIVYKVLELFFLLKDTYNKEAAQLLDMFFEERVGLNEKTLYNHLKNIEERLQTNTLTKENLGSYFFTQHPSPARIYRVWRETQEFFETVVEKIERDIYRYKWKRIVFSVDYNKLQSALKRSDNKLSEKTPYIIRLDGPEPEDLLVLHVGDGRFYTIESLEKYRYDNTFGEQAVVKCLKKGFKHLALENNPNENLLEVKYDNRVEVEIEIEEYIPLIEITISPLSLRLIVPTLDSIKITEMIATLYSQRFEKVLGKLPLSVKILTANRKFPLYVLLDAERRMLDDREFKKPVKMKPWWNVYETKNDDFFKFYPTKLIGENEKYTLDDLSSISKEKPFSLYPGYFDFDLLTATTDRYNIYYEGRKRGEETYRLYSRRPYYFYQISMIRELWDILSNLSSSQLNNIEEALATKLKEWRYVEDGSNKTEVFMRFAEATIKDAFGSIWDSLREETRCLFINSLLNGLLMDTIFIFRHMIKEEKEIGE